MPTINELKEQMAVVGSLGEFTNALQQIATIRMTRLRDNVLASRPFVEAANEILTEMVSLRNSMHAEDLLKLEKQRKGTSSPEKTEKAAVIVITSNQGLTGRYNVEIFQKVEKMLAAGHEVDSDFYVIGHKGQEYFSGTHFKVRSFPYEVKDTFTIDDLRRLVALFDVYTKVTLVYSRYINAATRDVVAVSVVEPSPPINDDITKQPGNYTFEPEIFTLIDGVSKRLRAALFQQQIFDSRLAQTSAQMIGMKTASDNAVNLTADLRQEYNKARRKMIDKKIGEVFAGSALW